MKFNYLKVTNSRYISDDGQYEITKIASRQWSVSRKGGNGYFAICLDRPFTNPLEAMCELNKAVA